MLCTAAAGPAAATLTLTETRKPIQPDTNPTHARGDGPTHAELVAGQLPCRAFDAELFFAESPDDVEYAKSLCRLCPARAACLAGAVARREPWGVWGGELFVQGTVVARKRPRGRPRKADVAA